MLILSSLSTLALAGCPNGCSNHGSCGKYDMCTCDRNWMGADCSERVCPFDYSFVTSPVGDVNFDGDLYDSFLKPIVGSKSKAATTNQALLTGSITINTNLFTFAVNDALATNEIVVGDSVLVNDETFVVTALNAAATPPTLNFATRAAVTHTTQVIRKYLESPAAVGGAWEGWPGYAHAKYDEAHYYMECSNKGTCDRKSGLCACFPGYTGKACTRMTCPGNGVCSGHGACESVESLRWSSPALQTFKALATASGETSIKTDLTPAVLATDKPYIRFGRYGNATVKVTAASTTAITVAEPIPEALADFTEIYVVHEYDLWDQTKARTCSCDPGWSGFDCSSRVCAKGDDPLTLTDTIDTDSVFTQENEKQTILISSGSTTAGSSITGFLGLTFEDQYGYQWDAEASHLTLLNQQAYSATGSPATISFPNPISSDQISVDDFVSWDGSVVYLVTAVATSASTPANYYSSITVDTVTTAGAAATTAPTNFYHAVSAPGNLYKVGFAASIPSALTSLPNDVIPSVAAAARVHPTSVVQTGGVSGVSAHGYRVRVDFTSPFNSGDLPEMGCNTTNLFLAKYTALLVSVTEGSNKVLTFTSTDAGGAATTTDVAVGGRIMIGKEIRTVTATPASNAIVVDHPFGASYTKVPVAILTAEDGPGVDFLSCTVTDEPPLYFGTVDPTLISSTVPGTDFKTVDGATGTDNAIDASDVAVNSIIKIATTGGVPDATGPAVYGPFEYRVVDALTLNAGALEAFTVSEAYTSTLTFFAAWVSEKGRTEAETCSRRGLCNSETALCECFPGYSGAVCQTQNSLAY